MAGPTPLLLRPDNFTPRARTPWGGRRLTEHYKRALVDAGLMDTSVGESWELSVGDELPSRDEQGRSLATMIDQDPVAWIGAEALAGARTTALLVKWLDTADDLSVQIHPPDDHPQLAPHETGKTEVWIVLDAAPDAALYVGLQDSVTEQQMRAAVADQDPAVVASLLRRWPVQPGDVFVVEPGMPHAIGRGITLLEPQTATAGKRAMTYRYWDWNRRYDAQGALHPDGQPRPLQLEQALAVTRWPRAGSAPVPPHTRLPRLDLTGPACWQPVCGPAESPCVNDRLCVVRLSGSGALSIPEAPVLRALTVVQGSVTLCWPGGQVQVAAGTTAVLPACTIAPSANLDAAHAVLSAVAV